MLTPPIVRQQAQGIPSQAGFRSLAWGCPVFYPTLWQLFPPSAVRYRAHCGEETAALTVQSHQVVPGSQLHSCLASALNGALVSSGVPALTTVSAVLGTPPEDKELGHAFAASARFFSSHLYLCLVLFY